MPIPNKKSGETENQFINRCMTAIGDEYPQDQALAICYGKFRENMRKYNNEKSVLERINKFNKDYEGINMENDGTINLEEPCWSGYIQIGMKEKNGQMVPNCVPKD